MYRGTLRAKAGTPGLSGLAGSPEGAAGGGLVEVAVKVQRPHVLETVSCDLFILRRVTAALRGGDVRVEMQLTLSLKSAWFQPLNNLRCDILVASLCFRIQLLYRYNAARLSAPLWRAPSTRPRSTCGPRSSSASSTTPKRRTTRGGAVYKLNPGDP
jgi:hypothetical protein